MSFFDEIEHECAKQIWEVFLAIVLILAIIFVVITILYTTEAFAEEMVDIDIIIQIESSGNPNAYNKSSGAIGLMQITPICLEEWNSYLFHKTIASYELYTSKINIMIGTWYLKKRIPQMLRYFKKPVTLENVLICYNAGINYVVKGLLLPQETINYILKYRRLKGLK